MMTTLADRLSLAPEVAAALRTSGAGGRPVVALESTLISHGLPYPENVAVARASEAAVRASGAVPATIAIHAGRILVGLSDVQLEALARAPAGSVVKAARPSLAAALHGGGWAATTVSATMIVAGAVGIQVFATGGIGGVHRGAFGGVGWAAPGSAGVSGSAPGSAGVSGSAPGSAGVSGSAPGSPGTSAPGSVGSGSVGPTLDISADLEELARTPVIVVCAGPKAILDLPLTLEYLETRGVPVVAVGQQDVPGFYSRESGRLAPWSVPDVAAAADLVRTHLGLGLGSSMLVCVPVPEVAALPFEAARAAIDRALAEAEATGLHGPELTPWLLARIGTLTDGASVRANTALIENDARFAGQLAVLLCPR